MDAVEVFLLVIAGVFAIGVAGELIFRRTGVPDVIWLVLVGMVLGPISGAVPRDRLAEIAPYFAALTLVVILFDGGSRLRASDLSAAAPRSGAMALASFTLSAAVVTLASMAAELIGLLPSSWTIQHGVMLGAIVGGSSSIIIMPSMAQAGVAPRVANLLNLESAFTDVLCVVGTVAMVRYMTDAGGSSPVLDIIGAFSIGLVLGAVAGVGWVFVLRWLELREHVYPVTLAALLALYVGLENIGGSAALGILAFAVVVGNVGPGGSSIDAGTGIAEGVTLRGVHSQIAFIVKSFFFTFIGAMIGPPWSAVALGAVFGVLLLLARWPAVRLGTAGSGLADEDRRLLAIGFPRGLAAGVLATLPAAAGIAGTERLATIVYACVPTTVLIFAVGFPLIRRRWLAAASEDEPDPANAEDGPVDQPSS